MRNAVLSLGLVAIGMAGMYLDVAFSGFVLFVGLLGAMCSED